MPKKYEKITLITATEISPDQHYDAVTALDFILDVVKNRVPELECLIVDFQGEDYELTAVPPERTLAAGLADILGTSKWVKREEE